MGFGTLFIGYFFLVNISYFQFTDILAAAVMLMGLYKLSRFNKSLMRAFDSCAAFFLLSVMEFAFSAIEMFTEVSPFEAISPYMSIVRYLLLFVMNVFIMRGIRAIANEVGASETEISARVTLPFCAVYLFAALFSLPYLAMAIGNAIAYIYLLLLVAVFAYVLFGLAAIYKAYMHICLPGEEKKAARPSSFDPLGKLFERMEKSGREYGEYKLSKRIANNEKQKNKRKK